MKKWLIILSILFTIGFISSAILAGRIYYTDLKTYEDYDKKALKKEELQNISIESEIPVEIHPTTGTPYAEFTQTYIDLIGVAPEYELEVEQKAKNTYITVKQTNEILLDIGVKEEEAKLIVYLPQGTINRLSIDAPYYYPRNTKNSIINLEEVNVNELKINTPNTDFNLNGTYGRVEITGQDGRLNMHSRLPSDVYISGNLEQYLSGAYKSVEIYGSSSNEIHIESSQASTVEIYDYYYAQIHLEGKYEKINIRGKDNDIDLMSETECELKTQGNDNVIYAHGAFKVLDLEETYSEIEVQTTVIPQSIQMIRTAAQNLLNLTLPSNIPGFTLNYNMSEEDYDSYYAYEEDRQQAYSDMENEIRRVQSDFTLVSKEGSNNKLVYQYGDGTVSIKLNMNADITLNLVDGGYSSVIENQ